MKHAKSQDRPELSGLELEVMRRVWALGTATAAEVRAGLSRPLADTTVLTVLSRLEKKGYVEPVPTVERARRWRPTVARSAVARRWTRRLVDSLFDGSAGEAMLHLLKYEKLEQAELDEIRRMLSKTRK